MEMTLQAKMANLTTPPSAPTPGMWREVEPRSKESPRPLVPCTVSLTVSTLLVVRVESALS